MEDNVMEVPEELFDLLKSQEQLVDIALILTRKFYNGLIEGEAGVPDDLAFVLTRSWFTYNFASDETHNTRIN